jgi:hypothetical protein
VIDLPAGGEHTLHLRLTLESEAPAQPFRDFAQVFADRKADADAFYAAKIPPGLTATERAVGRQAYAGLLWSEQFYHYVVPDWINGDATVPLPPEVRQKRINRDWTHLFSRDVLSVPDKWEYPAFFAWDLAFHMIPMARIDPSFAKNQLLLLLREWYLHPSGQLPAFEYDPLFVPQGSRPRPCHGSFARYTDDPHWRDYVLFYEYFDGDTGRGLGASHQTGWTALVACLLEDCAQRHEGSRGNSPRRAP